VQKILEHNRDYNLIVGGDLNDVFNPSLDRYRSKPKATTTEYMNGWKTICNELNLTDIWRVMNPDKRQYTWRQGSSATRLKQSRIDVWLISLHMVYELEIIDIKPSMRSDHSLIELDFYKQNAPNRGPSFWRFNTGLLKDKRYITQIKECLKASISKYKDLEDKGLIWDLIKMELRSTSISYSKFKAKEGRELLKETIINVSKLEELIGRDPTDDILKKYTEGKKYIEDYNNEKTNGAMLRSKVDWAEHGEKNTKFFLNLEKRNYKMKCITKLITQNEIEITKSDKILEYEKEFYEHLYTEQKIDIQQRNNAAETFKDNELPKISEDQKQLCENLINLNELGIALKELKNGKSPGSDGFTADFYKFFWVDIQNLVLESLTYANNVGNLSIDQRRGIINLIPKKDKDPRYLKNWRPISLLNTDYKIITKTLANRIKKVLPSVINPDQVAYLKNRFIGQNIRTIFDIMGYTKLMDKKGIIAFLDFEKAFDTIRWDVIYDALTLFNLGKEFI
jgi:hypothetical protein